MRVVIYSGIGSLAMLRGLWDRPAGTHGIEALKRRDGRVQLGLRYAREGVGPARIGSAAVVCAIALMLGACEGTAILKTASLSNLPTLPTSIVITPYSSNHSESTHEIYSRVARGAKTCWFGPGKPLVKDYFFDGEAASDVDGGAAEVAVHVRTPDQPNPRGGKVFIVGITKVADGSKLEMESRRIPDGMAEQLRADVARWAKTGSVECGIVTVPGAEVAANTVPLPERKPALKKIKGKK
jgi:hypothetical protein